MTIQERLTKAQESIQELSNKLNALEQDKQELLQAIIRADERINVFKELKEEEK